MAIKLKNKRQYSYRRIFLDELQKKFEYLYKGVVLDIGGRDRGNFKKPKSKVEKWIFADITKEYNPDIIIDVSDMKEIKDESIDVVNAMELFEHVKQIEKGLKECFRVLKKNGTMIISVPFLYPIHADPDDYQRWTKEKWQLELNNLNFKIDQFIIMGRYFTFLGEMIKFFIKFLPSRIGKIIYFFHPIFDLLVKLDNLNLIKNHKILGGFHGGYFIVLKK